jgi:hypothetical protein
MSDARIFISKNHRGNPWRELEMFTLADAASPGGPLFFNLDPVRVEILDQSFQLISAINTTGDVVRFYYNAGTSDEIRAIDLDVVANTAGSASVLPFPGRDPFIMDARTVLNPNRVYIVYVNPSGNNAWRQSFDLGVTWVNRNLLPGEELIDDIAATDHTLAECNINDPSGDRESVQVMQRRT